MLPDREVKTHLLKEKNVNEGEEKSNAVFLRRSPAPEEDNRRGKERDVLL